MNEHMLVSSTTEGEPVTLVTRRTLVETMEDEGIKMMMLVGDSLVVIRNGGTDWEPYPFDKDNVTAEITISKRKN